MPYLSPARRYGAPIRVDNDTHALADRLAKHYTSRSISPASMGDVVRHALNELAKRERVGVARRRADMVHITISRPFRGAR